jgi:hypothetical protein
MAPPKGTAAVRVAEKLGLFKGATKFFKTARRLTRELPQEPKRLINRFAKGPEHELTASQRGRFFQMAEQARDQGVASLSKKERKSIATATGGVNIRTGETAFGRNSNPLGCAEDDVVRQLGGDPNDILFSRATRPRLWPNSQVAICRRCQVTFRRSQFAAGAKFKGMFE